MGHVFHLAWYMNGVGFGDSSRTSVPKIMASYPPVICHCVEADDRGIYNGHHKMADPKESKFCFDSFSRSMHIFV